MIYNGSTKIIKIGNDNAACDNSKKVYQYYKPAEQETDWSQEYLTFLALEDGTFKNNHVELDYSFDGGNTWTTIAANTDTPTVTSGSVMLVRKDGLLPSTYAQGTFSSTGRFEVMGNPHLSFTGTHIADEYPSLFSGCTGLTSAENLVLPETTLTQKCYSNMFQDCTSLTAAPELPATTLAPQCYASMFDGCTSLATAPVLPATTLAEDCYMSMFAGCTSLTTAPALPATTLSIRCYRDMFALCSSLTEAPALPASVLTEQCYDYMFSSCTSLNYIKMLATDVSARRCLGDWVYNVASSGTFVKNASMVTLPSGTSGIPTGWSVVDA